MGQVVGILAHEQSAFWQEVLPEKSAETSQLTTPLGQLDTSVLNDDGPGFRLFGESNIHQAVFLEVLLSEYLLHSLQPNTPTALLQLLQNVERQGPVDHRGDRDGEHVANQKPDDS